MGTNKTKLLKDAEMAGIKHLPFIFRENAILCWKCKTTLSQDNKTASVHGSGLCKVCEAIQRKGELSREHKLQETIDMLNEVLQ